MQKIKRVLLSDVMLNSSKTQRLAYVAVTRAKKELYLLYTQSRMLYGRTEGKRISRFSDEIPEEVCDRKSVGTKQGYTSPINENAEADRESRNSFLKNIRSAYETRTEETHFPVGTAVSHPMFGEGTILSAAPMGGDVLYEIEFANGSTKRLMGNFAKLKKV